MAWDKRLRIYNMGVVASGMQMTTEKEKEKCKRKRKNQMRMSRDTNAWETSDQGTIVQSAKTLVLRKTHICCLVTCETERLLVQNKNGQILRT